MDFLYNNPLKKEQRRLLRRNQTLSERKLWNCLRNKQVLGFKFFRQYSCGRYILDFFCSDCRLEIEVDGGQHSEAKDYDEERTKFLKSQNITVIRFWNNEVLNNIEGVIEEIKKHLTPPSLPL